MLEIIRIVLLAAAAFNMVWTVPGVLAVFRERVPPLATFAAAIFWLSGGTVAFQVFALAGHPNEATRIGSCLTLLIGLGAAASLQRKARHLTKFGRLLVNVDVAMAIVDLWLVDHAAAEMKAAECRKLTAKAMSRG